MHSLLDFSPDIVFLRQLRMQAVFIKRRTFLYWRLT